MKIKEGLTLFLELKMESYVLQIRGGLIRWIVSYAILPAEDECDEFFCL